MNRNWINFQELREKLSFQAVLEHYRVNLSQKGTGQQFVGTCPLPGHTGKTGNTFSANVEKGLFQCFGCNAKGNCIDFAVLMEQKDRNDGRAVREVAIFLRDTFLKDAAPDFPRDRPRGNPPDKREGKIVVNQPLDFELKTLDDKHPYFAEKKLSAETVARFGLGFCKRGTLAGRIAVPLVDDAAELVGYAGLALDGKAPRYLLPQPRVHDEVTHVLDCGKFLYNGFRIGKAVKDLIVVREPHTVWHLWQGGFANGVALMGTDCSDEQAAMLSLLSADSARVWLLTDSSEESEAAAAGLLVKVAPSRLCRWVKVQKEEELVPEHPLLAVLPKR